MNITKEQIRAAGGIVHSDGNIFFTNIEQLNSIMRGLEDAEPVTDKITLPRKMDEDLYYTVGGALGAQSPEQCGRADALWDKLVQRADSDAATSPPAQTEAALRDVVRLSEDMGLYPCKKCGGDMKPGKALAQTVTGSHDFAGDQSAVTMSPGGPGKLIDCLKCEKCGWSVTGGNT